MYRSLDENEIRWIKKMLDVEFKGKEILFKQIMGAKVFAEQGYDYISIKFVVQKKCEKYPYSVRVPLEMKAFQEESNPIVFVLHIINGFIDELEIITADSSKINLENISLENVIYELDEMVR